MAVGVAVLAFPRRPAPARDTTNERVEDLEEQLQRARDEAEAALQREQEATRNNEELMRSKQTLVAQVATLRWVVPMMQQLGCVECVCGRCC